MLLLARRYGAGAYGAGAVPFLFLYFLVTGVVTGRAVAGLLRRLRRPLVLLLAVAAGAAGAFVAGYTWGTDRPGDGPLLVPMFLVILLPAAAWAVFVPRRARHGARATALVAATAFLVARGAGL